MIRRLLSSRAFVKQGWKITVLPPPPPPPDIMRLFSDSIAILSAREQPLYFAGEFEDNCPLLWKEKERKKEIQLFVETTCFYAEKPFVLKCTKFLFTIRCLPPPEAQVGWKLSRRPRCAFLPLEGAGEHSMFTRTGRLLPSAVWNCEGVNTREEARKMPSDDASVWIILALALASTRSFAWICMRFLKLRYVACSVFITVRVQQFWWARGGGVSRALTCTCAWPSFEQQKDRKSSESTDREAVSCDLYTTGAAHTGFFITFRSNNAAYCPFKQKPRCLLDLMHQQRVSGPSCWLLCVEVATLQAMFHLWRCTLHLYKYWGQGETCRAAMWIICKIIAVFWITADVHELGQRRRNNSCHVSKSYFFHVAFDSLTVFPQIAYNSGWWRTQRHAHHDSR